jgi:hypothetical protein
MIFTNVRSHEHFLRAADKPFHGKGFDASVRAIGSGPFWYDLAGYPLSTHARVLAQTIATNRLLYGSDSCWTAGLRSGT